MKTLPFATRTEAEHYLQAQGFVFMGAPNRWRRVGNRAAHYASIQATAGGVVVMVWSVPAES